MKNLRSHKHRCSNGHVWEHEAQVARMLDKELNKLDHTCGVCGEVQYVRVIEEERTKARVQHLAIEMLASAFEKMPDAGSIMVPWQERVKVEYNHANAARALATKLGWTKRYYGAMRGGALPDGTGYAFVFDFNDTSDAALYCFAPDPVEEGTQS